MAAQFRLRGSDAVHAAVALRFGATSVTLDREQRARAGTVLTACTPAEALAQLDEEFLRFQALSEQDVLARFDQLVARMAEQHADVSEEEVSADVAAARAAVER